MNPVSKINYNLRFLPCLSALGEEDLMLISKKAYLKRFSKNEDIFSESEPMKSFFIVRKGAVKLFKTSSKGREIVVKTIGKNDFSCCAPLYLNGRYFMNATAIEDSELVMIPTDYFKEVLYRKMGKLGIRIITGLCNRIRHLTNLVEELTFKDVEQRVGMVLLRLAEEKSPEDNIVSFSITHQDIASMTGTVREVVSRVMSRLKKKGVITDTSAKGFTINKNKLLSFLNKPS